MSIAVSVEDRATTKGRFEGVFIQYSEYLPLKQFNLDSVSHWIIPPTAGVEGIPVSCNISRQQQARAIHTDLRPGKQVKSQLDFVIWNQVRLCHSASGLSRGCREMGCREMGCQVCPIRRLQP